MGHPTMGWGHPQGSDNLRPHRHNRTPYPHIPYYSIPHTAYFHPHIPVSHPPTSAPVAPPIPSPPPIPAPNFPTPVPLNPLPSFSRLPSPGAPLRVRTPCKRVATGSASHTEAGSGRAVRWRFPEAAESGGRARGGGSEGWGSAMVDYSVWDHIEVSDDEDETHPNIDTASLFRWRHQVGRGPASGPGSARRPRCHGDRAPLPVAVTMPPLPPLLLFLLGPPAPSRGDAVSPLPWLPVPTPQGLAAPPRRPPPLCGGVFIHFPAPSS